MGRRRLAIVDAEEYLRLKDAFTELQAENTKLKEDADLVDLQSSLDALEKEVSALRTEKKQLEARLTQGSGSLDHVP